MASAWENYQKNSADDEVTTAGSGTASIDNLPVGTYRLIETDLGTANATYILDNKTTYEFTVSVDASNNKTMVTVGASETEKENTITVTNEKPTVDKVIQTITKDTDDTNTQTDGVNSGDLGATVTLKTTATIPSKVDELTTFIITETDPTGITPNSETLDVKVGTTPLVKGTDYTVSEGSLIITFTDAGKTKLKAHSNELITVTYDATIENTANFGATGNTSTAKLTYSTIVKTNYNDENNNQTNKTTEAEDDVVVYSGGLLIKKTDGTNPITSSSAIFKLSNNADGTGFIKDKDGNEITLTTSTTDGRVSYNGLAYGTYYLVEVQAPTYTEDGKTKTYNLLNKPKQITISATSSTTEVEVVNKKGTLLPTTGGIGAVLLVAMGVAFVGTGVVMNKKNKEET